MNVIKQIPRIDVLNSIEGESGAALWAERLSFLFVFLMVLAAPHSIAATQSAWILAMLFAVIRSFLKPRRGFKLSLLAVLLIAFFIWSALSSAVSYAPDISIDKLRGVSLVLVFFLIVRVVRTRAAAIFLALALVFSAMAAMLWTPVERIIGRGVQIYDFSGSAFDQIGLQEGDVLLKVEGKKVGSLAEVKQIIFEKPNEPQFKALISRADAMTNVEIPRERIRDAATPEESLGINRWTRSRNWRAAGFYGHFTTFAEVLQLIASLTFGLFIAAVRFGRGKDESAPFSFWERNRPAIVFGVCLAFMSFALLLTVTRASQLAFLISSGVIVLLNRNRKLIFVTAALLIPAAIIGLIFLQSMRRVSFFDSKDQSTTWRQTVYREGFELWTKSPRNFVFGVGMDSVKRFVKEWHLFDDGRLPSGHFHSTPLQLVIERGLPALLIWFAILGVYARSLWRGLRAPQISPIEKGILLGAFGGLCGFFLSGLVHYNLGDGEVATVFYLIMGLSAVSGEQ